MQQIVGTPVMGLLALTLMECAEGYSPSKPDASTHENDASTSENDASTSENDASTSDASTSENDASIPPRVFEAYVKADGVEENDNFGSALSLSGDTLAIGAPDSNGVGGAVYIFTRSADGTWSWQARLEAGSSSSYFGFAVSLSGNTLAVGAYGEDSNGAVYIFTRSDDKWSEQYDQRLTASNSGALDRFGFAVSLSGNTLAVGAPNEDSENYGVHTTNFNDNDSASDSGAVYVFSQSTGGTWSEKAYLKASNTGKDDHFGRAVSLSGNTLTVGAPGEDGLDDYVTDSGAVYAFTWSDAENAWLQNIADIKALEHREDDHFGRALSLEDDTLAVGTNISNAGVYIFTRTGIDTWKQQDNIQNPDDDDESLFGFTVSLSGDNLAVGAPHQDSNVVVGSGAVYVFSRTTTTTGTEWLLQDDPLEASNAGEGDYFGRAVSLSGDTLAVGAPFEDNSATGIYYDYDPPFSNDDGATDSGAVYLFH